MTGREGHSTCDSVDSPVKTTAGGLQAPWGQLKTYSHGQQIYWPWCGENLLDFNLIFNCWFLGKEQGGETERPCCTGKFTSGVFGLMRVFTAGIGGVQRSIQAVDNTRFTLIFFNVCSAEVTRKHSIGTSCVDHPPRVHTITQRRLDPLDHGQTTNSTRKL